MYYHVHKQLLFREPTELIIKGDAVMLSNAVKRVPLPGYAAFIRYTQHLLPHVVDMPYISNSWSLRELKDELKKETNGARA